MLEVLLRDTSRAFEPGGRIEGSARWNLDKPSDIELTLLWFTSGKGSQDVGVVESRNLAVHSSDGEQSFSFTLPAAPYSFSGKFIELTWAVELSSDKESVRDEFICAPGRVKVQLPLEDAPKLSSFEMRFQ